MTAAEILACAREAKRLGYGTVVLQSGEDPGLTTSFIADCISRYNETQARQGYEDRAHLEMRTTRVTRRRVR
jgi:2-iminoacetate synthase ThiH